MPAIAAFIACALGISNAYAQATDIPLDSDMQTVQVTGVRDPAMMPYKDAYEMLTQLHGIAGERTAFVIRVVSKESGQPVPGMELTLRGDNTFEKVPVSPEGFVEVPLSAAAYADKAEFLTNQKKGSLRGEFYLVPKLPSQNMRYGDILASIDSGQRALKKVAPWYLRWFIPTMKAVMLCYPDHGRQVQIAGDRPGLRTAQTEWTDYVRKEQVWCARFARAEQELDRDSLLELPPGWRALYVQ